VSALGLGLGAAPLGNGSPLGAALSDVDGDSAAREVHVWRSLAQPDTVAAATASPLPSSPRRV
jgi:hypothetical protein